MGSVLDCDVLLPPTGTINEEMESALDCDVNHKMTSKIV